MFEMIKRWLGLGAPVRVEEPEAALPRRLQPEFEPPGFSLDELRRAQQAYWRSNLDEKLRLLARLDQLAPQEALRALHLHLIDATAVMRGASADDAFFSDEPLLAGEDAALCRRLVARLTADAGPFQPRLATVVQTNGTLRGTLINASLSHLGALEVLRPGRDGLPMVDFVPFDSIRSVTLGPAALYREAVLRLDGAPDYPVPVMVPLLYGLSWSSPDNTDRDGSTTRFIAHVPSVLGDQTLGLGIGHQDFTFIDNPTLFGLGSMRSLSFDR